jgi:outer membrane protein TolC
MHRFLLLLIIPLGLMLNGCAEFEDKPLNSAESALSIETRELSSQTLKNFIGNVVGQDMIWPLQSWDVDSLSLAAIYFHPDMAVVRAQTDTLAAAEITAAQSPNPTLNTAPSYLTHLASALIPWYAVSTINIPIETAGKRGFRKDKAASLTNAARWRISETAWLIRGRLHQAILEAYTAFETERLIERQVDILNAMNTRSAQQFTAGELTRTELIRSQIALNQMQINLSSAKKRNAESRVMLANAIGLPVTVLSGININYSSIAKLPILDNIPVQKLKEIALKQRFDVLAALADYAAAQSALQLEIANQYPNIQANPGYAWEVGENLWSLGATIQLPVFHQNQGMIAEAEAKRREQAIRFQALQLRIIGDIDRAYAGMSAVLAKWDFVQRQIRFQQENLQSIKAQFQAGETDQLAVLGVELDIIIAERAQLDMLIETQQSLNALEDSLRYPITSTLTAAKVSDSVLRATP